ncbi:MAG: hypothetical protein WBV69_14430, partial [Candidatus Sulfotelmatobacter sp.]
LRLEKATSLSFRSRKSGSIADDSWNWSVKTLDIAGLSDRWESDARANEAGASGLIGSDVEISDKRQPEIGRIHAESIEPTEWSKFRGSETLPEGISKVHRW